MRVALLFNLVLIGIYPTLGNHIPAELVVDQEGGKDAVLIDGYTVSPIKIQMNFEQASYMKETFRKSLLLTSDQRGISWTLISWTYQAVMKFNELIETREAARIAVSEQVEAEGDTELANGMHQSHDCQRKQCVRPREGMGSSSQVTHVLDQKAKEYAEEYFNYQRSLAPPRRADAAVMRKRLEDAKNPTDPTASEYLLDYCQIPTEKQLTSLFSRLEKNRLKGPKKCTATAPKIPKTTNAAPPTSRRVTRAKTSVRATTEGKRKRSIVEDSEESDEVVEDVVVEDVVVENVPVAEEVEDDDEDEEILGFHEDDFIRKVIEEEMADIFD